MKGRPQKLNADYFSHDSDMRDDPKIKALRRKFDHIGYSVWCMLLEVLTDSDNFQIEYNDLNIEILSGDFNVDPKQLVEIIEYLKTLGLICIDKSFIFSYRLRERFEPLISRRKKDRTRIICTENTHSKVKNSKVEKSKIENNKYNTDSNESKPFSFTLNRLTQFDNLSIKYIEELKKYIAKVNCGMSFDRFKESCIMKGYKYKNFKMAYDKWNNVKQKEQEENKIGIYEQTILEIRQRHEEEEAERKLQEELDKNRTDDKPF